MREGGTSHKKNSCRFHDLSKTKEGEMIKSMNAKKASSLMKLTERFNYNVFCNHGLVCITILSLVQIHNQF